MNASDWITIIGWPITFILGILATFIVQKISQKRKTIQWAVVSDIDLSPTSKVKNSDWNQKVDVKVLIDGSEERTLQTISLQIMNTGSVELENIVAEIKFGGEAKLHHFQVTEKLGAWDKKLRFEKFDNSLNVCFEYINKGQILPLSFLLSDYISGDVSVDIGAPGVHVSETSALSISAVAGELNKGLALGIPGVSYDPNAIQTSILANEIRELKQVISAALNRSRSN